MKHSRVFTLAALMIALIMGTSAQGKTWSVPQAIPTVRIAVEDSSAVGDTVLVAKSNDDNDPYAGFTMKSGVRVLATGSVVPRIEANSTASAVVFPSGAADSTELVGFTILGGSSQVVLLQGSGVMRNCVVDGVSAGSPIGISASGTTSGTRVEDCRIVIDSGVALSGALSGVWARDTLEVADGTGFSTSGGGPSFEDLVITVTDPSGGVGISASGSSMTMDGVDITVTNGVGIVTSSGTEEVRNGTIRILDGDYGTGIDINSGTPEFSGLYINLADGTGSIGVDIVASGVLEQCTIDSVDYGVVYTAGTIQNCIVSNYFNYGFLRISTGSAVTYCIADGSGAAGYYGSSQGYGSVVEDPLYCDAANNAFTLRVDSYGNPENNTSGDPIGAFDVACMYGTLVRDAEYAGDGTLDFPGDVTIPSGRVLTIGPGTTFHVADSDDSQSSGTNSSKTELIVSGELKIQGTSGTGNEVTFESSGGTPGEGDWFGIHMLTGAEPEIDYAVVQHSEFGIVVDDPAGGFIKHSDFSSNQSYDMVLGQVANTFEVSGNTIAVASGMGIDIEGSNCDGLTVQENTITGTSASVHGIHLWASPGSPVIHDNVIEDFTNGDGIKVAAGTPELTENAIDNCKYGVYVTSGSPTIGTSSSSSDNTITNCTNGVRAVGSGATPIVRNNVISSNTSGVVARTSGNPDLGQDASNKGNNSILSNSSYCIQNTTVGLTVNAYGNWFGSCAAPTCTDGSVATVGYLCSAPASMDLDVTRVQPATGLKILSASPNPMTAAGGSIHFSLGAGEATLASDVFDISGRRVRSLGSATYGEGEHSIRWDALSDGGTAVPRGIYFIRLQGGNALNQTVKVLVTQ